MEVSVGIFSWDTDIIWVLHLLQEDPFKEMISQIMKGTLCVPTTEETWNCEAGKCTFILLYHSMRSGRSVSDMGDYLKHFLSTHGWRNVLVVIGAQEYTMSEKMREQLGQNQFVSCEQLFFTETEITILRREIRRMVEQVIRIRYILSLTQDPPIRRVGPMSLLKQKHSIGIISRSMQEYYEWLECLLRSKDFTDQVKDVRHFHISNMGDEKIREEISRCTFAILYITKVYKGINNDLQCLSTFGKENVIVVFDNLEDSSSEEKRRILQKEPSIGRLAREIFLFSMAEKESEYMKHLSCFDQVDKMMQEKLNKMEIMIYQSGTQGNRISRFGKTEAKYTIGIFSRSGHSEYKWLVHLLRSEDFRDQVQDVRPCYISNAGGRQFREDVSQCTFAILYHTKNRGRINITDVTDSMYDKKLHYLSAVLGKENVIVVVDDLEDSSSEEKRRILETQPSIGRLAQGLILFTQRVKEDDKMLLGKLKSMWLVLRAPRGPGLPIPAMSIPRGTLGTRISQILHQDTGTNVSSVLASNIVSLTITKTETKNTVGIFSRSGQSDYEWLEPILRSEDFRDQVHVRPCYISNTGGRQFRQDIFQCTFAILYHTKKRGRINITDVTDSLYDDELEYLSAVLGKENVIVMIDDLEDSSSEEKRRILQNQPKIERLAKELILLSQGEKKENKRLLRKLKSIWHPISDSKTQQAGAGDAGNQNNDNTKDLPKRPAEPGGDRGGLPQNLPLVPADPQARAHRDVPAPQETQQAGAGDAGNQNNDNTKDLPKRPAEPGGDRGGLPQNLPLVPADPQARAHRDVPAPQETQQAGAGDAGNQNNDNTKDLPKRPAEPGGDRGGLPQNLPLVPADPQARAHRDVPAPQETQQAGAGDAGNQNNDNTKDLPKRPAEPGGDRGGLPQNLPLVPADPQARAHRDVPAPQETQQAGAGDAGNQNNDNTKDLPKRPAEPGGDRGGLPQNLPLVPADPQARAHRDVPAPQGKELDVKNQAEKNMVTPGRLLLTAGRPGMLSLEEVVQRVGDNMDIQFGSKEDHYETPLLFQERGSYKEKTMTTCALVPVSLCDRSMDTEKGWIEYIFATCVLLGVGIGIDYLKPDALFSAIFSVGILLAVGALVLYLIQEDEKVESSMSISAEHFVYKHRATLIERLASLDPILDELLEKRLIHYEQYEKVRCERTSQDKMRMLYRFVRAWGICDLDIFYQILKAKNNPLIKDLEGL
ncbi:uncharacterized protein LOC142486593 isoform X2 [Ascaphus truei]